MIKRCCHPQRQPPSSRRCPCVPSQASVSGLGWHQASLLDLWTTPTQWLRIALLLVRCLLSLLSLLRACMLCNPGAGHKTEGQLQALGIATAADLRAVPRAQLVSQFGERVGAALYGACRGQVRQLLRGGAGSAVGGRCAHA